jgi:methionyl-tRNA formyltransferase
MAGVTISGALFLAARTTRSQAYLQALNAAGLRTETLIIYGTSEHAQPIPAGLQRPVTACANALLPDLAESIEQSVALGGWTAELSPACGLDDPILVAAIRRHNPRLVIFSGYPAQLVPQAIREIAPVLHFHSGALPDFRGSTTIYYSLLEGRQPAVSAILVDAGIDSGRIVAMQHYPPPPPGVDIDHLFDGAIRANLLAKLMTALVRDGRLPDSGITEQGPGRLYFIVHPVLKHIAVAGLAAAAASGASTIVR